MACLGLEPGVAGWWAQTNPLSYGGNPQNEKSCLGIQQDFVSKKVGNRYAEEGEGFLQETDFELKLSDRKHETSFYFMLL